MSMAQVLALSANFTRRFEQMNRKRFMVVQ